MANFRRNTAAPAPAPVLALLLLLMPLLLAPHAPRLPAPPLRRCCAAAVDVPPPLLRNKTGQSYCSPSGIIRDSCCSFETVEEVNNKLTPTLRQLVKTPFFKYYKVDLYKGCPFWQEEGFCTMQDCAVMTTDESDVPVNLRSAALSAARLPEQEDFHPFQRCQNTDVEFCDLDDEDSSSGVYVNLEENPEQFTGYAGKSANQIWTSIYQENCFNLVSRIPQVSLFSKSSAAGSMPFSPLSPSLGSRNELPKLMDSGNMAVARIEDVCLEKRVFYRMISGLHASISIHICHDFLNQTTGEWVKNLDCFINRVSDHPERLENVYFDFVLVLRAVQKISNYLRDYAFCNDLIPPLVNVMEDTGGLENQTAEPLPLVDQRTKQLVDEVLHTGMSCPSTFDENAMFADESSQDLKDRFKNLFRNITRIMDCVTCEKCRLWGKVQTTGLGTALKILFSDGEDSEADAPHGGKRESARLPVGSDSAGALQDGRLPSLTFQRTEIVALFNTLNRLSESIEAIETFRGMYRERMEEQQRPKAREKDEL